VWRGKNKHNREGGEIDILKGIRPHRKKLQWGAKKQPGRNKKKIKKKKKKITPYPRFQRCDGEPARLTE